jgi:hypothetical protein
MLFEIRVVLVVLLRIQQIERLKLERCVAFLKTRTKCPEMGIFTNGEFVMLLITSELIFWYEYYYDITSVSLLVGAKHG